MALANSTEPAFRDFASQLAAARLKLTVPQPLICWGPRSNGVGPSCPMCATQVIALLRNPECGHTACEDCWIQRAESQVVQCGKECRLYPSCLHSDCNIAMNGELWTHICSRSEGCHTFDCEIRSECNRLARTAQRFLAQDLKLSEPGPVCGVCQKHNIALIKNPGCGHTACEDCWGTCTEEQLAHCRSDFKTRTVCFHQQCSHPVEEALWQHICTVSFPVRSFSQQINSEIARLKAKTTDAVVMAGQPWDFGPRCLSCGNRHLALLQSSSCNHIACEDCWASSAEKQLPNCDFLCQLWPCCFDPSCQHGMPKGIWEHSRTRSVAISNFADERDKEVQRLMQTAGENLTWASSPSDAGPLCTVCNERHLALLTNTECGHMACENCWGKWVEVQLQKCRDEKQVAIRCFGEKCQATCVASIWSHSCTRSEEVRNLETIFERRRHVQRNPLFPPSVQVDCPQQGCLGLGYRGFDTVMCFMCEHQWVEGSGETPETNMSELIAGEFMKKCPNCGEYIIKNGGCDHMTCRCKHEFYWTTLKPFRS